MQHYAVRTKPVNCVCNHIFFAAEQKSCFWPVCGSLYVTHTCVNSRKMQQACMWEEIVNVIVSQRDDKVRWRGVGRHSSGNQHQQRLRG